MKSIDVVITWVDGSDKKYKRKIQKYLSSSKGPIILGMPSLESQVYASERSKLGHVNCKSKKEFRTSCKKYYRD